MIELRLDFLAKAPDLNACWPPSRAKWWRPCVARVDGGRWPGSEEERLLLLRQAIVGGFDWIDLETDIAEKVRRYKDVKRNCQLPQPARSAARPWSPSTSACAPRMPTSSRLRSPPSRFSTTCACSS